MIKEINKSRLDVEIKSRLDILANIRERHRDCREFYHETYQKTIKKASKVLMSKNRRVSTYGMFPVDKNYLVLDDYRGKLTNNPKKMDFKYYFDEQDRIILTERYSDGKLLNYIFYYYYAAHAESIMYGIDSGCIEIVQHVEWKNSKLSRVLESIGGYPDSLKEMNAFNDWRFEIKENSAMIERYYAYTFNGNDYTSVSYDVYELELK